MVAPLFLLYPMLKRTAGERRADQLLDVLRLDLVRRVGDEVEARQAPHRTPVDDMVLELRAAQIRRNDVLDRVHRVRMHRRLDVRLLHPDVERGDPSALDLVPPAHVDARDDARVVNLKAGYEFHCLIIRMFGLFD